MLFLTKGPAAEQATRANTQLRSTIWLERQNRKDEISRNDIMRPTTKPVCTETSASQAGLNSVSLPEQLPLETTAVSGSKLNPANGFHSISAADIARKTGQKEPEEEGSSVRLAIFIHSMQHDGAYSRIMSVPLKCWSVARDANSICHLGPQSFSTEGRAFLS